MKKYINKKYALQ